jgi:lauroyl/myristoyl acyltransferase
MASDGGGVPTAVDDAAVDAQLERFKPPEQLPPLPKVGLGTRLYADERVHRVVPAPIGFGLARARAEYLWRRNKGLRDNALKSMEFVVGRSSRKHEVEALAQRYLVQTAYRSEVLWRPWLTGNLPVSGVEHPQAALARGNGAILNFMHHGPYVGLTVSADKVGVHAYAAIAPFYFEEPTPGFAGHRDRQHGKCLARGAHTFSAAGGFPLLTGLLKANRFVGLNTDSPGTLEMDFLGRRVKAASGAAKLSLKYGSPIVPVVARDIGKPGRAKIEFLPPLYPEEHPDPEQLQQAIADAHAPAILAWPEALEWPLDRWKPADPEEARYFGFED